MLNSTILYAGSLGVFLPLSHILIYTETLHLHCGEYLTSIDVRPCLNSDFLPIDPLPQKLPFD